MYARISTFYCQAGKLDELSKLFQDVIVPANQAQAGCIRSYMLAEAAINKVVVITVWESVEAMNASDSNGFYQSQVARVLPLLTSAPIREHFEVKAHA